MRRSVTTCRISLRPRSHRLPATAAARSFPSRHLASSADLPTSSPVSSSSSDPRATDASLYSSSHLPSPFHQGQPQHSARHVPYVAYQSEYDDNAESKADDEAPTASSANANPSSSTPTPTVLDSQAADSAEPVDDGPSKSAATDSTLVSAINQLTIEGLRNESATGPATISNAKPLNAKYKPTSRKATTRSVTPQHGALTTLQLHRLLSLYALITGSGSGAEAQQQAVQKLADRFGVDAGKVQQLVQAMAVGRIYDEAASRGGVNPGELGEDKCAVWTEEEVPPGRRAIVQGAHLVNHLQAWERERQSSGR